MNDPVAPSPVSFGYELALHRVVGLADYERVAGIGSPLVKEDLNRMRNLAHRIGNPQCDVPVVHVAGTKGKGSTAAMISSVLVAAGHRVGLFTSPHLHTFRERIRVDGVPLSEDQFVNSVNRIWPHVEAMAVECTDGAPTTFELLTAMAFDLPRSEGVDVLVLEVGMGGRLDSTNVADAIVDVITSISLDHTAILGDTIELIATEKAGIIKAATRTVAAPQVFPSAREVITERVLEKGATLIEVGQDLTFEVLDHDLTGQTVGIDTPLRHYGVRFSLLGAHQAENAATAIAAIEAFDPRIEPEVIARGLANVQWEGRFQVLDGGPPALVIDGAHNPHSMGVLCDAIREYLAPTDIVVVFGCSGDKELTGMVEQLATLASYVVVCTSRHPRATKGEAVVAAFEAAGVSTSYVPNVTDALDVAREIVTPSGAIIVTGSLFVVGEVLEAWQGIEPERYPELDRPYEGQVKPVSGLG